MSNTPDLFPPESPHGSPQPTQQAKPEQESESSAPAPKWLSRAELFLRIVLRIYVGVVVFLLPWSRFWDQNPLFTAHPELSVVASHGAVRGIISGIGLLNLWIAITDAIYHREN